jgi:hypothetical protein
MSLGSRIRLPASCPASGSRRTQRPTQSKCRCGIAPTHAFKFAPRLNSRVLSQLKRQIRRSGMNAVLPELDRDRAFGDQRPRSRAACLRWRAFLFAPPTDGRLNMPAGRPPLSGGLRTPRCRLSHTKKCIGAPNRRKLLCGNDFLKIRGRPDDDRL